MLGQGAVGQSGKGDALLPVPRAHLGFPGTYGLSKKAIVELPSRAGAQG